MCIQPDRHTDDSVMYFHLENNVTYLKNRPPDALHVKHRFKHMKLLRLNWESLNIFLTLTPQ